MGKAFRWALVACVLLTAVAAAAILIPKASEASAAADPCCFTNPRFTGVCQVVPSEGETCASILAFLNNPNSSGKAYCKGTTVRGGWQQVACEDSASAIGLPEPGQP